MTISDLHRLFEKQNFAFSTDTRSLEKGDIYFAWRGEDFDGNSFVQSAFDKGASYAIIDNPEFKINDKCFLVENGMETLQNLSQYHRRCFDIPVFALTGSNGKTTTKELIAAVLSSEKRIVATEGNLNNHVGVPKTLLKIRKDTEIAIIEMGANHLGEIADLCKIAEPTHGLITNVGRAHIGLFGGEENIFKAKTELYDFLKENNGHIFVQKQDKKLFSALSRYKQKSSYGQAGADYEVESLVTLPKVSVEFAGKKIQTNLTGEYNIPNIAAGIALGKFFKISEENICSAVESYYPDNKRSEIVESDRGNIFIKDYYNANFSSMKLALENLAAIKTEKNKIVILGDMFELGDYEFEDHNNIVTLTQELDFKTIILVGEAFSKISCQQENIFQFKKTDEAIEFYKSKNFENSYILFKASNGMKFKNFFEIE